MLYSNALIVLLIALNVIFLAHYYAMNASLAIGWERILLDVEQVPVLRDLCMKLA